MQPGTFDEEAQQWDITLPGAQYYSVQNTARILGMGTTQLYSCINRETMIAYRVDGVVRIKHSDLVAYIEKRGQQQAGSDAPAPTIERVIPKNPPKQRRKQGTITAAIARVNAPGVLANALAGQPQHQPLPAGPVVIGAGRAGSLQSPGGGQGQGQLSGPGPGQGEEVPVGGLDLDTLTLDDDDADEEAV